MGISSLNVLLNNISGFFHISALQSINLELFHKYHRKTEDILKPLETILSGIVDTEISFESLQKSYVELSCAINELRELFETWEILSSKVYFVVQAESLIVKIQTSSLEVVELLVSSNGCLCEESILASFEHCILKIKSMDYELLSTAINEAIYGATSNNLAKIADYVSLKSNQELLIELVSLERLKENAETGEEVEYIEQIIALVTRVHDNLVREKQAEKCGPVSIPPDFCCSLSLELMTDPVIVSSGQTYERAFIQQWINLGLAVCPKTRQTLAHTNLISNYTVKALIVSWCESNNVKLPDPVQSLNSSQPSSFSILPHPMANNISSPDSTHSTVQREASSPSHSCSSLEENLPGIAGNGLRLDVECYENKLANLGGRNTNSVSHFSMPLSANIVSLAEEDSHEGHNRSISAPSTLYHSIFSPSSDDGNEPSLGTTADASVEVSSESQPASAVAASRVDSELPSTPERIRHRLPTWNRLSERFYPRIVSSYAAETRADLVEVEEKARKLVDDLKAASIDRQRTATAGLRILAKLEMDNRIVIANSGAISLLVNLLYSEDMAVQENAVTTLLNLSINDNNKYAIADANAIEPLVHVLETGSPEAKENAAASLYSISVIDDCKVKIGRSGAIKVLVDLMGNGTPRGKKDAATALFSLSILHENKTRIVQAGAVKHLVELMDPATALIDKAVAVLSNLSTVQNGRLAIGQEGGITALVDAAELGSSRVKEHAAAALMQLCSNSIRYCNMALRAGAVPPLVALSRCGTARAREKALGILVCLRNQRNHDTGKG